MVSDIKDDMRISHHKEGNVSPSDSILVETLFNNIQDGLRILDRELNIERINKVSIERSDLEGVPIKGKCYELIKGIHEPCPNCPCIKALKNAAVERATLEFSRDNGSKWYDISAFPISDENGSISGVMEISRDITEQVLLQEELKTEREHYKDLFDNSEDAIFIQDLLNEDVPGNFTEVNNKACSRYGYSRDEFLTMSEADIVIPECLPELYDVICRVRSGQKVTKQVYHCKKNGEIFPVEVEVRPHDVCGRTSSLSIARDISGKFEAQEALESRERLYENLFKNNHAVMLVIDPEKGELKDVNPAACRYYGYSRNEMLSLKGWELNTLFENEHRDAMKKARDGDQELFQFKHRLRSGEIRDVEVFTGPIEMDGKKYLYSIVNDITERIRAEDDTRRLTAELLKASRTDKLTGISNRAFFEEILFRDIDKAKRYQTCLSLIMFDLDNYKDINDSLGHLAGDMVLKRVAETVNTNVRNSDCLARWGGDEFMILTPMRLPSALKFAEKLRSVIENLNCGVTASFGVAEFSREDTIDQLTRRVDRALYQAKARGKNTVSSYEEY